MNKIIKLCMVLSVFAVLTNSYVVLSKSNKTQVISLSESITFECADGYKMKWSAAPDDKNISSACVNNPDPRCCECILGRAICDLDHGGLKPGSHPNYCNVACGNTNIGNVRASLKQNIPTSPQSNVKIRKNLDTLFPGSPDSTIGKVKGWMNKIPSNIPGTKPNVNY